MSEEYHETEAVPANFTLEQVTTAVFKAVNGARRKNWHNRRRGCRVVPIRDVQIGNPGFYCMTTSLANGGVGLGTVGLHEPKVRELCAEAGFSSVRRVPLENPFNNLCKVTITSIPGARVPKNVQIGRKNGITRSVGADWGPQILRKSLKS